MAEFLSPGVFIEEVPSTAQVIPAVSTSNMGVIGMSDRGPTNKATLVTSFDQYTRIFGELIRDSRMGLSVAAFFANGGRRAYAVRVVRQDATAADAKIRSKTTNQVLQGGGGVAAVSATSGTTTFKVNAGASPLVNSTVSARWRSLGVAVPTSDIKNRAGALSVVQVVAQANYEGRVAPLSLVAIDPTLDAVVQGTATLSWDPDGLGARLIPIPASGTPLTQSVVTVTNGNGSVVTLDHRTGLLSIKFAGSDVPIVGFLGNIQIAMTPTTATRTISDNGLGAWTDAGAGVLTADPSGALSITDGSYSFTTNGGFEPYLACRILTTYTIDAWDLNPISQGSWANSLKLQISGSANFFDAFTGTYSRFDVLVLLENSQSVFEVVESYEELVFDDPLSASYFADVINDLSDYFTATEPSGNEAPLQLSATPFVVVAGGGDQLAGNKTFAFTLGNLPVATRTLVINYTDSTGTARQIKDNGYGVLTGDVANTPAPVIDYALGTVSFTTSQLIRGGTLVSVTYYQRAAEPTLHEEQFGDTAKGYTIGTDGIIALSRTQISAPALNTGNGFGMFSLNQVDEIMQVIIPDFPDDTTIVGDELDYAEDRKDRYIILTVPQGSSAQEAVDYFRFQIMRFSNYAAMYWPWVMVADPLSDNRSVAFPPLGHIAGIYARTDSTKNVGKTPAGTVDGALRFLTGLEHNSTQGERDIVYPNKINPLISQAQTGLAVWGGRQIALASEWRYINARRLFMFVEKSVFNATHWIVFENNGPALWSAIKIQLSTFMLDLFSQGYFAGARPTDAFFVTCDETNNSQASIDNGQVIIDVGFAPNKPAEFVRFRFQQTTLGS